MPNAANDEAQDRLTFSDADLRAYAEGRLEGEERHAVEGFLACNPDIAAQVMRHLHMARRRRTKRRPAVLAAVVGLAACLGSGLGWAAAEHRELDGWRELDGGAPPEYVEEAAEARQAANLRGLMNSQVEIPQIDAPEIRRSLSIDMPPMPADWLIRDAQVFPSDDGPAVNLVIDTPDGGRRQLFVMRSGASDHRPELAGRGGERVIFWQWGGAAYVLSGSPSVGDLRGDAALLGAKGSL